MKPCKEIAKFLLLFLSMLVVGCPGVTTVPDVRGSAVSEATAALVSSGFTVGTLEDEYNPHFRAGEVIRQTPDAGSPVSRRGHAVNLVVSRGMAPVTVPDLVGLTYHQAKEALVSAGLTVGGYAKVPHASVGVNLVSSHSPEGGAQVAPGSAVSLAISSGPLAVMVPDLSGLTRDEASVSLAEAGLALGGVGGRFQRSLSGRHCRLSGARRRHNGGARFRSRHSTFSWPWSEPCADGNKHD